MDQQKKQQNNSKGGKTIPNHSKRKYISVFGLITLNIAAVMSLRGLPMMAYTGLTMIFYLLFSTLLFFIPCALVAAELATGWPGSGGVYRWVSVAFGTRWGFLAIWLQWIQNVAWYPTVLAFAAATLSYVFDKPQLINHHSYTMAIILLIYWLATATIFRGLTLASLITKIGVSLGIILPGIIIITLGIIWLISGSPNALDTQHIQWIPDFSHFNHISFLAGIILLFAGMEVGAVHARELSHPDNQFPKATFISAIVIIIIFSLGSMAVAIVIPQSQINLTSGIMQAYSHILNSFQLHWMVRTIGLFMVFGTLASVLAWITGPSKGLLATARDGEIPPWLAHTNKHGIQTHILIVQGIIVTLLSFIFIIIHNINSAFFLLSTITVSLYLVMYLLMFSAAIRLRYSHPEVKRSYKIPGKNLGMWLVAGTGVLSVLFALIIVFFPPENLLIDSPHLYVGIVITSLIVFIGLAVIINAFKNPSWLEHPHVDPYKKQS